jgi:hypothetical protein
MREEINLRLENNANSSNEPRTVEERVSDARYDKPVKSENDAPLLANRD